MLTPSKTTFSITFVFCLMLFSITTINTTFAQCVSATDCDGDGVLDDDDLDDDNDGILDSNEGYAPPSISTLDPVPYSAALNGVNNAVSGNLITITRNCLPDFTVDFSFVSTGGDIPNLTSENGDTRLAISYDPNLSGTAQVTYTFSESVDVTIGFRRNQLDEAVSFITPYDNITPGTGSTIVSAVNPVLWHNSNNAAYTYFEFLNVTSVVLELQGDGLTQHQEMSLIYIDNASCLDTDNDGIFDHNDLDSDDDSCPDAVEAGNTDQEQDGILGTTPTIVDATNGLVTGTAVISGYNGNQPEVLDDNTNVCAIILPVELVDFQMSCTKQGHRASWKTISERNNSHFVLQGTRDITASTNWEAIATTNGANNSTEELNYFIDFEQRDYTYFRLKQVNLSGKEKTSDIIYFNCPHYENYFSVRYKVESADRFLIIEGQTHSDLQIFDIMGRVVFEKQLYAGNETTQINVSDFTPGTYIVRVGNQSQLIQM